MLHAFNGSMSNNCGKNKMSAAIGYGEARDYFAPYRALQRAIIERAVRDLTTIYSKEEERKYRRSAIRWILNGTVGSVTFLEACEVAELTADEIHHIRKLAYEAGN